MERRLSENFAMDAEGMFAMHSEFVAGRERIAETLPGTRVSAVACELAALPWCDPAEALRAVQVACAHYRTGDRIDWIRTRERMVMARTAAKVAESIVIMMASGKPFTMPDKRSASATLRSQ